MGCTTILVGRGASYDGSTIIARNEDSPNNQYNPKRLVIVHPDDQPRRYKSVISHVEVELPENPQRYSAVPNATLEKGIWGEAGVNEAQVGMSATETLTTNERVLGADPLVRLVPAKGTPGEEGFEPEVPGGIGEEDFLTIVLPYVRTAREGVLRLGRLLERYGTYEMNGVAFSDEHEIWWLETVGGHHWVAKRVPDDAYVTMPNQLGIDSFDLDDALGVGQEHLCSADLRTWMAENHLDLTMGAEHLGADGVRAVFNPREAFGSRSERDHVYNTCRAWYIQRKLNPSQDWDGPDAAWRPEDDDLPWAQVPERKVTIEDVKDVLSSHYEGTPFDPYGDLGTPEQRRHYRPIGINRQGQLAVITIRPDAPEACRAVQWMAFGSNPFNTLAPFYPQVGDMPAYLRDTPERVSTESFYWANRLIAVIADAHFADTVNEVGGYRQRTMAFGHQVLREADAEVAALGEGAGAEELAAVLERANERVASRLHDETDALLAQVLFTSSNLMRNRFSLSDH